MSHNSDNGFKAAQRAYDAQEPPDFDEDNSEEGEDEEEDPTIRLMNKFLEYEENEYCQFKKIENPTHPRPDVTAFLLLDKLCPAPGRDIVSGADHDEIYLEVDMERLAEVITDEEILILVRCGVRYHETDSLAMFV